MLLCTRTHFRNVFNKIRQQLLTIQLNALGSLMNVHLISRACLLGQFHTATHAKFYLLNYLQSNIAELQDIVTVLTTDVILLLDNGGMSSLKTSQYLWCECSWKTRKGSGMSFSICDSINYFSYFYCEWFLFYCFTRVRRYVWRAWVTACVKQKCMQRMALQLVLHNELNV